MAEWLHDWLGGVALAATTGVGGWLVRIGLVQQRHSERLAVLEQQAQGVPALLSDIRDEIKGLREDGRARGREIYEHINKVRLELKADIGAKADK